MKKLALLLCFMFLLSTSAHAFLYEDIKILTQEEVKKLSDKDLENAYLEARIEEKASSEFHRGAGFSNVKEYRKRKELLRYIYYLKKELSEREKLDLEEIDTNLR
ncbi:MAG: hypothetical protein KC713_08800 [Candidatus Omnitrophica bacterium]|nr:hypothetical protein [Candidatus Omnitrophota bacterium]